MVSQSPDPRASSPPPVWAQVLLAWRWPVVAVVLLGLAFLVWRDTVEHIDRTASSVGGLADTALRTARGLLTGNVTETFRSALPELDSSGSGSLELTALVATETFTRSDERRILWDAISLGTTVSEIKVPVTYRYHLRLDDAWRVEIDGPICRVVAPRIRPTLPPAIHTEGLEKRVEQGWLRFDADEQLDALERSITPRLRAHAGSPHRLRLIREESRRTVADFVKTWLLRERQWGAEGVRIVDVVLADELADDDSPTVDLPSAVATPE